MSPRDRPTALPLYAAAVSKHAAYARLAKIATLHLPPKRGQCAFGDSRGRCGLGSRTMVQNRNTAAATTVVHSPSLSPSAVCTHARVRTIWPDIR